jgi:hypothetical protein
MHGTWKVTGGGAGGGALAFAAAAAAVAGVEWVIAWLWLIVLAGAVCAALATAAAMWAGAWYERRAALVTVHWPVQQQLRGGPAEPAAPPRRAAVSGGVTINIINLSPGQQAAVIRQVTGGGNDALGIDGPVRADRVLHARARERDQGPLTEGGEQHGL